MSELLKGSCRVLRGCLSKFVALNLAEGNWEEVTKVGDRESIGGGLGGLDDLRDVVPD